MAALDQSYLWFSQLSEMYSNNQMQNRATYLKEMWNSKTSALKLATVADRTRLKYSRCSIFNTFSYRRLEGICCNYREEPIQIENNVCLVDNIIYVLSFQSYFEREFVRTTEKGVIFTSPSFLRNSYMKIKHI